MKEIKVRVWDHWNKKFVYINISDPTEADIEALGIFAKCEKNLYTGLKDKNGTEIYEFMELDNKWEVDWLDGRYILRDMSNGDIISLNYENEYTITREYTKIQKNYEGSAN